MKKWLLGVCLVFFACGNQTVNLPRAKGIRGPYAPVVSGNMVIFSLYAPEAESVTIAGTFNGWNPESTPLVKGDDGVWRVSLSLVRGRKYAYKFVMDGFWIADPENPDVEIDGFGGYNSVIVVVGQEK
ncbi:CBM48 domain containing protein [Brevinematales bacterium NS]|nr:CBM48 domain containing protein [Brevinematales bacterium NS]